MPSLFVTFQRIAGCAVTVTALALNDWIMQGKATYSPELIAACMTRNGVSGWLTRSW
ncbi:hypothetical protein XBKB1_4170027 [Xenorhabdus bovienii str. kraussei Becker Underwood]|uniref:Uncharacterized protein n=1 Tax=Xenorhabdus bovienii str. kraussei Becker Underwood TaxID=1398204 RepID=A0A077PYD2_XENBV|nr:hypothetical protein XBKB1_4170027 [Xenorhabdus bovienii str. kraussei Becker Underwood]